ncbi:Arabinanase/levansucrase/invertase [Desarmillaria tabescens]|uniref:Arabinanase/levansucrase/invertase n=1 Tax=Armillaria tabescens TaxID=1929756 RepID=A0AA39NLS1_ARMTA|nr:Arabinanase/levansucrase/invertase [Desarmillaria tabescens]KAK0467986.1 Arabinanase/levansucrase/invertase [Desarmillaria tabescens]
MLTVASLLCATALLTVPAAASITGPVIQSNFPDPSVIQVDGMWYAFSTNSGGLNIPVATSSDFNTWTVTGKDALPTVGTWSNGRDVWAPDVIQLADGSFVLYYAALLADGSTHCVATATSKSVAGPYTPQANALACHASEGGAIDPAGFTDADGSLYVVYKVDGNHIGHGGNCNNGVEPIVPTPIMIQRMQADGITPTGNATQILDRGQYDGPLIEAPSLVRSAEGIYVLFFSSNCYDGGLYDTSYATASNVLGPYTKSSSPLFVTGDPFSNLYSPEGADVTTDGTKLVFHADLGTSAATRQMYTAEISINGTKVSI